MEHEITVLKQQVQTIADGQVEMKTALKDISASLKSLTRLEVQHSETQASIKRAFSRIDDHEERVRKIEDSLPTMKMATGLVFKATLGVLGILGSAALLATIKGLI